MSLEPLFAAPVVVQIHAFAAMAAFVLGIVQFSAPKGTLPHRTLGYIWVGLMLMIAVSSFWCCSLWRCSPHAGIASARTARP
jgi:uncharacterized membrane protein